MLAFDSLLCIVNHVCGLLSLEKMDDSQQVLALRGIWKGMCLSITSFMSFLVVLYSNAILKEISNLCSECSLICVLD